MKRVVSGLIIFVLFFQCMVCGAAEAGEELVLRFDLGDKTLYIDGKWSESAGEKVSLVVKKHDGQSLSELNTPVTFDVVLADADGIIHISEKMPETLKGGRYDIILACEGRRVDNLYFIYVNEAEDETIGVMDVINKETDASKIKELLISSDSAGDNAAKIGVDLEDKHIKNYFGAFIEELTDIRETLENKEFTSVSHFHSVLYSYVASALIADGNTDEAMKNYSSYFSTTYEEYSELDSTVREYLGEYLEKSELDIFNLSDIYRDLLILSELKACSTWSHLEDKIKENAEIIGIDTEDEEKVSKSYRYKIYMNMFDERAGFESLTDVSEAFKDAIDDVGASEKKKNSGTSGGGGGSKKSSVVVSPGFMEPVVNNETKPTQDVITFSDIASHFSKESVERLFAMGIISGYPDNSFRPDNPVTRAEFSKMISDLFDIKKSGEYTFDDVSSSDWYYESVISLALSGIIEGYGASFGADDYITREDAAVILSRCANYLGSELTGTFEFADRGEISDYASDAVGQLASNGIIQGDGSGFKPKNNITRGETAVMILRFYEKTK